MEARRKVLGVEHPSALPSMHNFVYTMKEQGREVDAIQLIIESV